jgi:hypothetical protein
MEIDRHLITHIMGEDYHRIVRIYFESSSQS